jgi:hypothetical protein
MGREVTLAASGKQPVDGSADKNVETIFFSIVRRAAPAAFLG